MNKSIPAVTHATEIVMVADKSFRMDFAVKEAFWSDGRVIVLLDPNSYLADPAYGKDRRRGALSVRNLCALSDDGILLWQAELPESVDYYYRIESRNPLVALSFSSYRCEIDAQDGHIIDRQFLK